MESMMEMTRPTLKTALRQSCISKRRVLVRWPNMLLICRVSKRFWKKNSRKKQPSLREVKKDTGILLQSSLPLWKNMKD